MRRIALDLDRPALARADQHALRATLADEGARVVQRLAVDAGLRHVHVRMDAMHRRARAGAAGQRHRRRHELQRPAPRERGRQLRRLRRLHADRDGGSTRGHADHRWQVEQSVRRRSPCSGTSSVGGRRADVMAKTSSRACRCGLGSRWQSRHHCIWIGWARQVRGIWSTRPWHSTQPTPLAMWMSWRKNTYSGNTATRCQSSALFCARLCLTASSIGAPVQICE